MAKQKVPFKNRARQVSLRFCVAILCMVFGFVLQVLSASPGNVVINEIAWMGTKAGSGDEWIELANNTNFPINIKDWSIYGADSGDCVNFADADGNRTWVIPSYGYLIYANHEDDVNNSAMETNVDIWDATISMVNSSPGQVVLYDAPNCTGTEIDRVNQPTGGWFAGNSTDRTTMERIDPNAAGVEEANWVTNDPNVARNGLDTGQFPINGTPKSKNSATNSATNSPPTAAFTYSPLSPTTQQTVQFTNESNDPDGSISSWQWSFGDGGSSTTQNPTHQYTDDGAYTVTLKVTDDVGATDSTSHSVTVSNQAPIASFDYSPPTPETNEIVNFDASGSSDPDGSIEKYKWDFGDSSTGTGQKLAHSYSDNNTYTVTLTVTDDDGATNTISKDVTVANVPPEIELETPAGGEIWKGTKEIRWDGTDPDDSTDSLKITLGYSPDNGITWNTIITDTENDGTYSWDTTKVVNGEYKVKIVVEDPAGLTAKQTSDSFTINNVLLDITLITHGPNPVPAEGCIFWLNLPDDTLDATITMFDIDGAGLVDILLDPVASRYPLTGRWLPQDEKGRLLGTGLYLYVVKIEHTDGTTTYSPVHKMVIEQ